MSSPSGPPRFGRVVTAMVTPFDNAGALPIDAAITSCTSFGPSTVTDQPVA
jgi:hypothetical protein